MCVFGQSQADDAAMTVTISVLMTLTMMVTLIAIMIMMTMTMPTFAVIANPVMLSLLTATAPTTVVIVSWRGLEVSFGQSPADDGSGDSDYLSGC